MPHSHSHNSENIKAAFLLNLAFTIIEIVGGLLTNSVAILADALHDLGDSLSLGLSWWLEKFSEKKETKRFTYGFRRFSLLGSLVNALVLSLGSVFILLETIPRIISPEETHSLGMIALSVLGIGVNGLAVARVSRGKNENMKVLTWHLMEDVLGWVAVLIGGILIHATGFFIIDPILSIGVTLYILWNVFRRLSNTVSLFLQSTPQNIDMNKVIARLTNIEGVVGEHHTHAWSLDGEHHVLTTHLQVGDANRLTAQQLKDEVRRLAKDLGFSHVTVEIDLPGEDCSMSS